MGNTSIPSSAHCTCGYQLFHHQGLDTICIASTAYCACKTFQLFHHQGIVPGHHQYDISRALHLDIISMTSSGPCTWTSSVWHQQGLVPGHHQYDIIRALYLVSNLVFYTQSTITVILGRTLYPKTMRIPSSKYCICGQYSSIRVYHQQGTIPAWHLQYTIISAFHLWTTSIFHHQGLSIPEKISITSFGHCT